MTSQSISFYRFKARSDYIIHVIIKGPNNSTIDKSNSNVEFYFQFKFLDTISWQNKATIRCKCFRKKSTSFFEIFEQATAAIQNAVKHLTWRFLQK